MLVLGIICSFIFLSALIYCFLCYYHGGSVPCPSKDRLDGKTVLITGGSRGIGREVALCLALRGARVIIASRNQKSGAEAINYITENCLKKFFETSTKSWPLLARLLTHSICVARSGNSDVTWMFLDLNDWTSVHQLSNTIKQNESHLNILINNAGISDSIGLERRYGCDPVFSVNYLGHFLLTQLLLDLLIKSSPSRIINMSSFTHQLIAQPLDFTLDDISDPSLPPQYSALEGYDVSKLALALFTKELARRYTDQGVTSNYVHPGIARTNLRQRAFREYPAYVRFLINVFLRPMFISPMEAAQTTVYLAVGSDLTQTSGLYYRKCRPARQPSSVLDEKSAAKLWHVSRLLTGCTGNGFSLTDKHVTHEELTQHRTSENFSVKKANKDPVQQQILRV